MSPLCAHKALTVTDYALTVLVGSDWGAQANFVFLNTHMSNDAHSVWTLTRISLQLSHPNKVMP